MASMGPDQKTNADRPPIWLERRGEEGVTIITEVFGLLPVLHSNSLGFMSSSGLQKPLQALPLTLDCLKASSNLSLIVTTVHLKLRSVQHRAKSSRNGDSKSYLTAITPVKQSLKMQNHTQNCEAAPERHKTHCGWPVSSDSKSAMELNNSAAKQTTKTQNKIY